MQPIILSLASSALVLGLCLAPFAGAQPPRTPVALVGKDQPILLKRMVVTATPLPALAR